MVSKAKIDKAGKLLASEQYSDEEYIEADDIFNEYRESHLKPLTDITAKIQSWMDEFPSVYYMAYRLKRRPQILRKLLRFTTRLSQLQDIGGCRIIVEDNQKVDAVQTLINKKLKRSDFFKIKHITDYRDKGRDITGYRAVHLIVERDGRTLEIQIRSRMQHYWAESIERTSVIYRHNLKEMDGHEEVLHYFKVTSDIFYELECGHQITPEKKIAVNRLRNEAERIIKQSVGYEILHSNIGEKFIAAMESAEYKVNRKIQNWLLIFDWKTGNFQNWQRIDTKKPEEISKTYVQSEKRFSADDGYEVVIVGASDVATIRRTHSHYFGIESYESILDNLEDAVGYLRKSKKLSERATMLLFRLSSHGFWGKKYVSIDTVKNHYNINSKDAELGSAIDELMALKMINYNNPKGTISLNLKEKKEIMNCIYCI